ncbi:MAG: flagellar biosynthesis protein FlhF [Pseudomonadales bacterium]|nr:flagellar biosynthesis protein FlhF [Pseudomonadales bacterium]
MKVKRFFAATMQEALKLVRDEMGADAVILSSKKIDDGVEIVTALDYDEEQAKAELSVSASQSAPTPGQLASMKAEKHLALLREMERSKERITAVRKRRDEELEDQQDTEATACWANQETIESRPRQKVKNESLSDKRMQQEESVASASAAQMAEMKSELSNLRELIKQQLQDTARKTSAVHQKLQHRLDSMGMERQWATSMLDAVTHEKDLHQAWRQVLGRIAHGLSVTEQCILEQGGRVALVGATGAGKTTTIGKLATRFVMANGAEDIALVTTDRYRIAAHEQLRVFGRILDIPVHVVDEQNSLQSILVKLKDKKLVLIDTAGLNHQDGNWKVQNEEIMRCQLDIKSFLVIPATTQPQIMKASCRSYHELGLKGCIVTKIDEALSLGEVISFLAHEKLPLAYIADGQKIPDDIHVATAPAIVSRAVKLMQSVVGEENGKSAHATELTPGYEVSA